MQYKLHLNLRQRAALRIAILFWEKKEVQDRIEKFFEPTGRRTTYDTKKDWRKLTKTMLEEWNKDLIPQKLEIELIHVVKMIGEKIYDWYRYIEYEGQLGGNLTYFIDKIYWTLYGTVDEIQTFKSSWLLDDFDPATVYNFACRYMLEEHINSLWDKIPKDEQDDYFDGIDNIYTWVDRHILAYWKCCRDGDLPNLIRYFEASVMDTQEFNLLYNVNRSPEENMLRLSVHQGYHIAVKYFWEKLTKEERDESVLKCARITVMRYNDCEQKNRRMGHKRSQYVEICLFLMNQMTRDHKEAFFNEKLRLDESRSWSRRRLDEKSEILKMLLFTWPWQELFIPVLKDMLRYQDDNSTMDCIFLNAITRKMIKDHKQGYSLEMSRYRSLLREAWLIIPKSIKQKLGQKDWGFDFMSDLMKIWDLDSLKLILNDPVVECNRSRLIEATQGSCEQFIFNDQYEELDQFIEGIFRTEEEKSNFKMRMDTQYYLIRNGRFDLADKMLDWQCSTPEKRQSYKSRIEHITICEHFIQDDNYDLLDEFIDWKLDTEEEKKACKDHLKNDEFPVKQIHDIWKNCGKNIDEAKKKCSRLLSWLFESDEEKTSFKKTKIAIFGNTFFTSYYFSVLNNAGITDDFLSWCLLDNEEIQRIKQIVSQSNVRS